MRIRDVIFANKKHNQSLNESYGTNYNAKEIQTLKTEGSPYNTKIIKTNNNKDKFIKSKNINVEKYEKIIVKKNTIKKKSKRNFFKIRKKK